MKFVSSLIPFLRFVRTKFRCEALWKAGMFCLFPSRYLISPNISIFIRASFSTVSCLTILQLKTHSIFPKLRSGGTRIFRWTAGAQRCMGHQNVDCMGTSFTVKKLCVVSHFVRRATAGARPFAAGALTGPGWPGLAPPRQLCNFFDLVVCFCSWSRGMLADWWCRTAIALKTLNLCHLLAAVRI
jgi:hypothetical protein